jgi:hypothetical protein
MQLPTGGAVYFDRGVIEVVTPVIELAPACTARMVRNLWEQIGFVRGELTNWGHKTGHTVRLKAYSSHYNISYEIPKSPANQASQREGAGAPPGLHPPRAGDARGLEPPVDRRGRSPAR